MILNRYHRELLAMRTYLGKFAIQVGYVGNPELIQALDELIAEGYVRKIDRFFAPRFGNRWMDVYQLTPKGNDLVRIENIVAIAPGSPEC